MFLQDFGKEKETTSLKTFNGLVKSLYCELNENLNWFEGKRSTTFDSSLWEQRVCKSSSLDLQKLRQLS